MKENGESVMAIAVSRKNFLTSVSISAAVHIAALTAVLAFLAPVPAIFLPFNSEDQDIISVSLVGGVKSGAINDKSKEMNALITQERRQAPRVEDISEIKKENPVSEEPKNELTEKKYRLSYAALDVYANGHLTYSDRTNGNPEKASGNGVIKAAYNGPTGNGPSEGVRAPLLIPAYRQNNPPRYPVTARIRGHEGLVTVSAEILANGTVGNIILKKSSGFAVLDDSALEAVRKWLFQPGRRMGVPVPMWVDVPIRFALNE